MSRYHKKIATDADGLIDLYAIAEAFGVKSNPQFHAFKKTIMAGQRGDKGVRQDIDEAIQALQRWKEMVAQDLVRPPMQFNCPPLCSKCHTLHHVFAPCPLLPDYGECKKCGNQFTSPSGCPACAHEKPEPFHPGICPGCYLSPSPHPRTPECTRI